VSVTPAPTGSRNGLPPGRPYVYRAPRPDWAVRALAEAEAACGTPPPDKADGDVCACCPGPVCNRSHGLPVCRPCYRRWQRKGFPEGGPGPSRKPLNADSAREHLDLITTRSAREAAAVLGCTDRTIQRWRRALDVAS
jgi:hypothetical protein